MLALVLLATLLNVARAGKCANVRSCSTEALKSNVDTCCVASPSGLFVFRQRFEPDVGGDMGSWGIDGLEVSESVFISQSPEDAEFGRGLMTSSCTEQTEDKREPYGPSYSHEEIGSFCHRSSLFGAEGVARTEGEWAQSEVGEGVEEQWERAVRHLHPYPYIHLRGNTAETAS